MLKDHGSAGVKVDRDLRLIMSGAGGTGFSLWDLRKSFTGGPAARPQDPPHTATIAELARPDLSKGAPQQPQKRFQQHFGTVYRTRRRQCGPHCRKTSYRQGGLTHRKHLMPGLHKIAGMVHDSLKELIPEPRTFGFRPPPGQLPQQPEVSAGFFNIPNVNFPSVMYLTLRLFIQ